MKKIILITVWQFVLLISTVYSQTTLEDRLKQHTYTLADDSLMGRKAGSKYAAMAADYIVSQWKEIGIKPLVNESYFVPFIRNQNYYNNLVGVIEGNDSILKKEYIIVGAHYDHIGVKSYNNVYNGADDNASGVATVIELGRNLKALQSSLRRSIILVAFDAEEEGLYGSEYFSTKPPVPIENIKLMFSVDMVGWYKASGYIKYYGSATVKNGKQLLLDKSLIPTGLNVIAQKFESSIFTATDTEYFAKKGIPTFAVTTGTKSPYHKPEDDAHLIDYKGMALITEHLTNVIMAASQTDSLQATGKKAFQHRTGNRFVFGISVNIGNNYHYYTEGALDGKQATSGGIGFTGQINFNSLAIRPEIYYDFINAKYPAGNISTQSITIPVNLLWQTSSKSMIGMSVFGGGYYSYNLKGQQGGKQIDFENIFNREEMGYSLGFEMRIANFRLGYINRNALTNFTKIKNVDGAYIRNRTLFFNLGYTF